MTINARTALDAFLWFQTISLLTERHQTGLVDLAVNGTNGVFLCLFVYLCRAPGVALARTVAALAIGLILQLSVPAFASLAESGSAMLFPEIVKLAVWLSVLVLAIEFHDRPERIDATLRTIRRCAAVFVAAIAVATVLKLGSSAYGLGIIYLGSALNVPSVSMYALGLLIAFLAGGSRVTRILGIVALLIVLTLLMKRSSLAIGLVVAGMGLHLLIPAFRVFRIVALPLLVVPAIILAALTLEVERLLPENDVLNARLKDMRKLIETEDLRYLGSGRVGLLDLHWSEFEARPPVEQVFGAVLSEQDAARGGYLGRQMPVPHNDVVEVLSRGGIASLAWYLSIWAFIGISLFRGARINPGGPVAVIGLCAFTAYAPHIIIGVLFKTQFMILIALYLGIALRARAMNHSFGGVPLPPAAQAHRFRAQGSGH